MAKTINQPPKIHAQDSARSAFAVTPHDTNVLAAVSRALYVGGGGTLVVRFVGDSSTVSLVGVLSGTLLPIQVDLVHTTTSATSIVALV